jgi:hypothetical protein
VEAAEIRAEGVRGRVRQEGPPCQKWGALSAPGDPGVDSRRMGAATRLRRAPPPLGARRRVRSSPEVGEGDHACWDG